MSKKNSSVIHPKPKVNVSNQIRQTFDQAFDNMHPDDLISPKALAVEYMQKGKSGFRPSHVLYIIGYVAIYTYLMRDIKELGPINDYPKELARLATQIYLDEKGEHCNKALCPYCYVYQVLDAYSDMQL